VLSRLSLPSEKQVLAALKAEVDRQLAALGNG